MRKTLLITLALFVSSPALAAVTPMRQVAPRPNCFRGSQAVIFYGGSRYRQRDIVYYQPSYSPPRYYGNGNSGNNSAYNPNPEQPVEIINPFVK